MITTALIAAGLLVLGFLATYKVIGANEAHIVVFMGFGRRIMSPIASEGVKAKTSYFYVPFLMKQYVMPLTNVKLDVDNIKLHDNNVAPFKCDVVTWLHIKDPVKATERLDLTNNVFGSLQQDLNAIVQSIARAAAMKQEILDIMRDRATFAKLVSEEVGIVIKEWGVELVNLEVNDIRDDDDSEVIKNYELMRKASVESSARIVVATRDREAIEVEQENKKLGQIATAQSQKESEQAFIEKDKVIGVQTQQKEAEIAVAQKQTNQEKVAAYRVTEVGNAEVKREAAIQTAQGEGEALRIKGEKAAEVVRLEGNATADAVKAKGLAEAEAKLKMAEALQKFNDAATGIEKINAWKAVQVAFAEAYGKMAENADIKVVTSGDGASLFGIPLNASTGANLGQMLEGMDMKGLGDMAAKLLGGKKESAG